LSDVHQRLHEIMVREFNNVYGIMEQHQTDMRTAAYIHAMNRQSEAVVALGTHTYFTEKMPAKFKVAGVA
jgi:glutamate dehydrogenase (NADP+)